MALLPVILIALVFQGLDLYAAALNDDGMVLLRFREGVQLDPYGALAGWTEGSGENPCLWFGVGCSGGRVVDLNLSNLCLKGTLTPQLGKLIQLKSLILHNNSFYGVIPKEIAELQKLELLDLGYNDFTGLIPSGLSRMTSLKILIISNNRFTLSMSTELNQLNVVSELEVDEELLSSNRGSITRNVANATIRRLLQVGSDDKSAPNLSGDQRSRKDLVEDFASPSPSVSPSPSPSHLNQELPPSPHLSPSLPPVAVDFLPPEVSPSLSRSPISDAPIPAPAPSPVNVPLIFLPQKPPSSPSHALPPSVPTGTQGKRTSSLVIYLPIAGGLSILLGLSAIYFFCCRANKVVSVKPWSTGLSGQLQKAFVTDGVPALRRSELETACEDFSNVIGTLSDCMLYKGTLSSGVEIAVTSSTTSEKDWSQDSESQFRNQISTLSRVNHKNFMNLLGYCEEENPFTRMLVFEYAPNGTLFEHLHIKEAEHLDWTARLRIAMGIAYCLEHMQQLEPPITVRNLNSSSVYLTEDYAAKISDLELWRHAKEANPACEDSDFYIAPLSDPKVLVYKFGIILLEILSGRRPFSQDDRLLVRWASCYFNGKRPLKGMIDATLKSFREEDLGSLGEVVNSCVNPDPRKRPTMVDVTKRLRQITSISPEAASPRLSPLWWAELEILSTDVN